MGNSFLQHGQTNVLGVPRRYFLTALIAWSSRFYASKFQNSARRMLNSCPGFLRPIGGDKSQITPSPSLRTQCRQRNFLPVADRWAVAAYIRALQFSQRASMDDVPAERRADLDRPAQAVAAPGQAQEAH